MHIALRVTRCRGLGKNEAENCGVDWGRLCSSRLNFSSLKAPINLQALRAIALVPRDPIVSHPPYAPPRPDFPNPWLNSTPSVSDHSSPMLKSVDNKLILRLAAAGFNPTSLTNLAGQGHWEGFAGLLASTGVSMCPKALSTLYQHFRRVHRWFWIYITICIYLSGLLLVLTCCSFFLSESGLKLNSELYREEASKPSSSPLWCPQSRQLKTLSLAESLEVMTRSCDSKRVCVSKSAKRISSSQNILISYSSKSLRLNKIGPLSKSPQQDRHPLHCWWSELHYWVGFW